MPHQLKAIKTSRVPNRVNLIFLDNSYLPLFVDDVVKLSLQKNQKIGKEKLSQIIQISSFYLGYEYALRQIAISPKTEKILSQKLKIFFFKASKKYKYFSDIDFDSTISDIVNKLTSKNLLNQSDFIKSFISKNRHKSKKQIKYFLSQKEVDTSNLDLKDINDIESIKKVLARKKISPEFLKDFKLKNKLYSSLFRKGFELSDIKVAIDDYFDLQ